MNSTSYGTNHMAPMLIVRWTNLKLFDTPVAHDKEILSLPVNIGRCICIPITVSYLVISLTQNSLNYLHK